MSDESEAEAAGGEREDAAAAEGEAEGVDTTESEEPEAEETGEGLAEGDFVRLAYTMRTAEDGTLVDTTDEEIAEDEGIDTEDQEFGPRTIVLGAGHVFEAVEEELYGKEVGDSGTVAIPAAGAFGEHDSDQVRTVSADRIPEDERHIGGHVDLDGEHGHVETIIGGRARVDFNHPLAGEEIEYEYEVLDVVEDRVERAAGLFEMYLGFDLDVRVDTDEEERPVYDDEGEEEGTETVEIETLYVESTPQLALNQQWLFSKGQIANEIIDRVGVDRVIVREVLDGSGGLGGLGGLGMGGAGGGLEEALEDEDLEDVDAEEIVEELEVDPGDEGE